VNFATQGGGSHKTGEERTGKLVKTMRGEPRGTSLEGEIVRRVVRSCPGNVKTCPLLHAGHILVKKEHTALKGEKGFPETNTQTEKEPSQEKTRLKPSQKWRGKKLKVKNRQMAVGEKSHYKGKRSSTPGFEIAWRGEGKGEGRLGQMGKDVDLAPT